MKRSIIAALFMGLTLSIISTPLHAWGWGKPIKLTAKASIGKSWGTWLTSSLSSLQKTISEISTETKILVGVSALVLAGLAISLGATSSDSMQQKKLELSSYSTRLSLPHANCYWVHPQRLMAGEYPGDKTVQATVDKLNLCLDKGVTSFIDLTEKDELVSYENILYELAQKRNISVTYKRIAIVDMSIPSSETMHEIINAIKVELNAQQTVYVHCWGGIGRTGTVVACYLTSLGKTGKQALEQLASWWKHVAKYKTNPFSPQTQEQFNFVLQYRYMRA